MAELELVFVLVPEFGEVEIELELLVLEVTTLLPLLVPVWSLELPVPPSFLIVTL